MQYHGQFRVLCWVDTKLESLAKRSKGRTLIISEDGGGEQDIGEEGARMGHDQATVGKGARCECKVAMEVNSMSLMQLSLCAYLMSYLVLSLPLIASMNAVSLSVLASWGGRREREREREI